MDQVASRGINFVMIPSTAWMALMSAFVRTTLSSFLLRSNNGSNVCGLSSEDRQSLVAKDIDRYDIDILALQETKTRVFQHTTLPGHHQLYLFDQKQDWHGGLGFVINKRFIDCITSYHQISDRVAYMDARLKPSDKNSPPCYIRFVNCYSPTNPKSVQNPHIADQFYDQLDKALDVPARFEVWFLGDFNAKIGKRSRNDEDNGLSNHIGRHSVGRRNQNGDRLLQFFSMTHRSDHKLVMACIDFSKRYKLYKEKHRRQKHLNTNSLVCSSDTQVSYRNYLDVAINNTKVSDQFTTADTAQRFDMLFENVKCAAESTVGYSDPVRKRHHSSDSAIVEMSTERKRLLQLLNTNENKDRTALRSKINKLSHNIKKRLKNLKTQLANSIADTINNTDDSRRMFEAVRQLSNKNKKSVSVFVHNDSDQLVNNNVDKCKIVREYFQQHYTSSDSEPAIEPFVGTPQPLMNPITTEEVAFAARSHIESFDGWEKFCKNIVVDIASYPFSFVCNMKQEYNGQNYPLNVVCDGKTDCSNGADEFGCPLSDRFYCQPNTTAEWVHTEKTCDSVKDCSNGADECGTCEFEALSSSKLLIQSKIIVAVTSIMGILIVSLNIKEGYKCWKTPCSSKTKSIDKIFLSQIFLYDGLMGMYLFSIVLATMVLELKGDYCLFDHDWRASKFCSALGVMFSLSSHGSLIAIASISLTRFLKCHSFVADISMRKALMGSIFSACFNIFHSAMPLLPIDAIQDTFRTGIFLQNLNENPFFSSNPIEMTVMTDIYNGMFHQVGKHNIKKMTKELSNITSKRYIFDLMEISYYGNTGLCVHNIFKGYGNQFTYHVYKVLYCTVLITLLSVVSTGYIMIVLKQRRSNKVITNSDATGSNAAALTFKVALMIGSQLTSWISFITTVLYYQYMTSKPAPHMAFEMFALVVIPINSFLNPIFYSERYKILMQTLMTKWKMMRNLTKFLSTRVEPTVVSIELQPCNIGK
ncbi:hypothetical protein ACHWQZ_G009422 [Mnemiopsis leidyi]